MSHQLTEEEVKDRLASYGETETATTNELYEIGLILVTDSVESLHRLDAKAHAIAGYSAAVFGVLFSAAVLSDKLPVEKVWPVVLFLAAVCALIAAFFSMLAVKLRSVEWFSPDEWFKKELLSKPEGLRRYHVLCMYGVRQSNRKEHHQKARNLRRAQILLCIAYLLMFLSAMPALLAEIARVSATIH
jgi:hypothetical protein